jgi:hypothetical protein
MVRGLAIASQDTEAFQPVWTALMGVEPSVHDAFTVGIDRAENTRKDLEGQSIAKVQFEPETSRAKAGQRHFTKIFGRDTDLFTHCPTSS